MRPPLLEHVTLAVLAGGAGTRMGTPKSLLSVGGKPILTFIAERLAWPGPTLLVTAPGRESPPGSQAFQHEAADAVAGEGPLRGVYTALTHATTRMIVVIGVDMPAVTTDDLAWFVNELTARPAAAGVIASRGEGTIEPLPAALRPERALGLVSDHLAGGRRSLHGLAKDGEIKLADASALSERVWTNVNTPADWDRFLADM
jgi:molybdopterin-guanine dinucleotide biosynthesis protein A